MCVHRDDYYEINGLLLNHLKFWSPITIVHTNVYKNTIKIILWLNDLNSDVLPTGKIQTVWNCNNENYCASLVDCVGVSNFIINMNKNYWDP